jgi:hypothetical protein
MALQIICTISWFWLCITLGIALFATIIMSRQGRHFYTKDAVVRQFSIMDLEVATKPEEISNIIKGMYVLPEPQSSKAIKSLKGQLYTDFIFVPAIYGSVFLICMQIACKMSHGGEYIFAVLAWLQALPFLCDIIENIYLLNKIKADSKPSSPGVHAAYQKLEIVKWGLSLTGGVCALSALFYFWVAGYYSVDSLKYLLIIVVELIIFGIGLKIFAGKPVEGAS